MPYINAVTVVWRHLQYNHHCLYTSWTALASQMPMFGHVNETPAWKMKHAVVPWAANTLSYCNDLCFQYIFGWERRGVEMTNLLSQHFLLRVVWCVTVHAFISSSLAIVHFQLLSSREATRRRRCLKANKRWIAPGRQIKYVLYQTIAFVNILNSFITTTTPWFIKLYLFSYYYFLIHSPLSFTFYYTMVCIHTTTVFIHYLFNIYN